MICRLAGRHRRAHALGERIGAGGTARVEIVQQRALIRIVLLAADLEAALFKQRRDAGQPIADVVYFDDDLTNTRPMRRLDALQHIKLRLLYIDLQ